MPSRSRSRWDGELARPEDELEDAEWRLAERQRRNHSAPHRLDTHGLVVGWPRRPNGFERLEPASGRQRLELPVLGHLREPRRLRPGRARRDPHHLVRSACLLEPGAECVAREHELVGKARSIRTVSRAERPQDEAELRGGDARSRGLARVEPATGSQQLDAPQRNAVSPHRDQERIGGAGAARRSLHCARELIRRR